MPDQITGCQLIFGRWALRVVYHDGYSCKTSAGAASKGSSCLPVEIMDLGVIHAG